MSRARLLIWQVAVPTLVSVTVPEVTMLPIGTLEKAIGFGSYTSWQSMPTPVSRMFEGAQLVQIWYGMSALACPCCAGVNVTCKVNDWLGPSAVGVPVHAKSAACVPVTGETVIGSEVLLPLLVRVTDSVLVAPTCTLPKSRFAGCTTIETLTPLPLSCTL